MILLVNGEPLMVERVNIHTSYLPLFSYKAVYISVKAHKQQSLMWDRKKYENLKIETIQVRLAHGQLIQNGDLLSSFLSFNLNEVV